MYTVKSSNILLAIVTKVCRTIAHSNCKAYSQLEVNEGVRQSCRGNKATLTQVLPKRTEAEADAERAFAKNNFPEEEIIWQW